MKLDITLFYNSYESIFTRSCISTWPFQLYLQWSHTNIAVYNYRQILAHWFFNCCSGCGR